jgi:hypothetical protein
MAAMAVPPGRFGRGAAASVASLALALMLACHAAEAQQPLGAASQPGTGSEDEISSWEALEAALARANESLAVGSRSATIALAPGVLDVPAGAALTVSANGGSLKLQGYFNLTTLRCMDPEGGSAQPVLTFNSVGNYTLEGIAFIGCQRTAASFDLLQKVGNPCGA